MDVKGKRKKLSLDLSALSSPMACVNQPVFSPMTELSINFQNSCTSHCSTPRRKLSLSGTPTPKRTISIADSVESGIDPDLDSPFMASSCAFPELIDSPIGTSRSQRRIASSEVPLRRMALQKRSLTEPSGDCFSVMLKANGNQLNFSPGCIKAIDVDNPDVLATSPDSLEVASLTERDLSRDPATADANRSLSAPPILDSVEKYFEDLEDPSAKDSDRNDDGFSEFIESDARENDTGLSSSVKGLLSAPIISIPGGINHSNAVTKVTKVRGVQFSVGALDQLEEDKENKIFKTSKDGHFRKPKDIPLKKRSLSFSVKRPEPPRDVSPVIRKKRLKLRSKSLLDVDQTMKSPLSCVNPAPSPGRFGRSFSLDSPRSEALTQLLGDNEDNLIGDASRKHCLPTCSGRKEDLKTITTNTLNRALGGEFDDEIGEMIIVDCRYPYEYNGGHIKTAVNVFTKDQMLQNFLKAPKKCSEKRQILVFHCEFSSQRGPAMYRFLRNKDRDIHKHCYPKLHYPELYLLEGGYKAFFAQYKEQCTPQSYLTMHDENYSQELKHFAKRSKSWTEGNSRTRTGLRY